MDPTSWLAAAKEWGGPAAVLFLGLYLWEIKRHGMTRAAWDAYRDKVETNLLDYVQASTKADTELNSTIREFRTLVEGRK